MERPRGWESGLKGSKRAWSKETAMLNWLPEGKVTRILFVKQAALISGLKGNAGTEYLDRRYGIGIDKGL